MTSSGSRSRLLLLVGVAAVLLVLAIVGVKLPGTSGEDAGNGNATSTGAKSLTQVLSEDQQAQLDRVTLALDSIGQSTGTTGAQAAAAATACDQLDSGQPMLRALGQTCQPYIMAAKLTGLLKTRCGKPKPCARVFRRLVVALPALTRAEVQFAQRVASSIAPGACAEALKPDAKELASLSSLGSMAKDVQAALEGGDNAALRTALEAFEAKAKEGDDGKTPLVRIDEQRRACGMKAASDPPA